MRIISLNVNNFGGLVSKPLIKDYLIDGKPLWNDWNKAVITWRKKIEWENNVTAIVKHVKEYDVIVFQEVDTNSDAFEKLKKCLDGHNIVYPNGTDANDYSKGFKSITVMFVKNHFNYITTTENFSTREMKNVEIIIDKRHIIGIHISMGDLDYWDSLIKYYRDLKDEKLLIIGDMNVYDWGTKHKSKFIELLSYGAIDTWIEEGNSMNRPTANTGKRIDYTIMSPSLYKQHYEITIDDILRNKGITDHSAVSISI